MSEQQTGIPLLPYTLHFPTGKVRLSDVGEDRERKNGSFRFSALAGKPGSLYLGDTFLGGIRVNADATGFSFGDEPAGLTEDRLREIVLNASIRLRLSAGPAWIRPESISPQPGDLVQLDTDVTGPAEVLFHDSGAVFAAGEVLSVGDCWGVRIQSLRETPVVQPEPKGYMAGRVFLGSIDLRVQELLSLGEGSILQMDTPVTEPLGLDVAGTVICRGMLKSYMHRKPSFVQTFTQEVSADGPKLFFRLGGQLPGRSPAEEGSPEEALPSMGQFLAVLPPERLYLYLKSLSVDAAAFILKCCVTVDGGKAATLLKRLVDRPGLVSAFVGCNPSGNIAHLDKLFSAGLATLCTEEERGQAAEVPPPDYESLNEPEKSAAEAVVTLSLAEQQEILARLREENPESAEGFGTWFFFVEDLVHLDDLAIQKLLREVDTSLLAVVLSESDEPVKEKVFNNMSRRAAVMLKEDMEFLGSVAGKRYNEAATRLLSILQRLIDTGEIVI